MTEKINVVFCYAQKDKDLQLRLEQQLSALKYQGLIDLVHQQVDPKLLITYGALLCRGEMSIRDIVKILGLSGKYKERFINLKRADKTIELLYATFLRQQSDPDKKLFHTKELLTRGSNVVIADLIDSEEYDTLFR